MSDYLVGFVRFWLGVAIGGGVMFGLSLHFLHLLRQKRKKVESEKVGKCRKGMIMRQCGESD